jgi:hypothetical protein
MNCRELKGEKVFQERGAKRSEFASEGKAIITFNALHGF